MRGTAGLLSTLYLPEHWRGLQGSGATHTNTSAITTPREGDCSKVYKSQRRAAKLEVVDPPLLPGNVKLEVDGHEVDLPIHLVKDIVLHQK